MMHEQVTTLASEEVFARAKQFFSQRVPHNAAFPEQQGPGFLVLRGQGGEEIAMAAVAADGQTHVRASTLFFDQAVERFLHTLPVPSEVAS
jgi:hypothetical protein